MAFRNIIRGSLFAAWLAASVVATFTSLCSQPRAANAGYVEPGACAECHREIAESYARTGMARSFGVVRDASTFPELKGGSFHHESSDQFFTVSEHEGRPQLKRHQLAFDGSVDNLLSAPIDYWFGSGNHARSYVSRTKSGELVELPLTWYGQKGGRWAMSPSYDRPDHAGFSRKITYRCMSCHNGYPEVGPDAREWGTRFPDKLPEGIDCQRCHGPGQEHVNAIRQGLPLERARSLIVNPARLPPERQMEVCMQCHLETTSLKLPATLLRYGRGVFSSRPGEPLEDYALHFDRAPGSGLDDRFEFDSSAYRLRKSPCFVQSRGALTCTTCHNPHEPSTGTAAAHRYISACQSCHRTEVRRLVAARRHPAAGDCASCHMPKRRPVDAVHVTITDHYIRKRPVGDPPGPLAERHDANTPPYRGEVMLYYPPRLASTSERDLYLALAQVKHESNLDEGLRRLEAAIARTPSARAEFYFELAEGYRHAGRLDQALTFYRQAASRAPDDWRGFYRLGTSLTATGELDGAAAALARAAVLAPQEPAVLEAVAEVLSRRGRGRDAVATLRTALALDPESANLHNHLGARLLLLGDVAEAERAWREAVRLRPESAAIRLNLANLLASRGGFREARHHFRAALRSDGTFAEAHHNLGLVLVAEGAVAEAEQHFREAVKYAPHHYEAHLRLGQLLSARNEPALAAPHLRKAAESPDARVRAAAGLLLMSK